VYLEALAVGIPVIGFHKIIDEFKEITNTYVGESFNATSEHEEDLKNKILKCLSTPFDAKCVRETLIKYYSWESLGPQFLNVYYTE
jgi:glycosyltransferase involved in cell wall biosynthesis